MVPRRLLIVLATTCALPAVPALAAHGTCDNVLANAGRPEVKRTITADDLVGLRDIGYSYVGPGQRLVSVSPDGRNVAFAMFRADPASNHYCTAIIVIPLRPGGTPRILDENDEIILESFPIRGVKVDYGSPATILPKWSPDGRSIAYLRRENGSDQVWQVPLGGGSAVMVTHSDAGVDHFAWARDGRYILFADRPERLSAEAAVAREGLNGYLYDDRIVPYSGSKPAIHLPLPYRFSAVELKGGATRPATLTEASQVTLPGSTDPAENRSSAISADGRLAEMARDDPADYLSPTRLVIHNAGKSTLRCAWVRCTGSAFFGVEGMWWTQDAKRLIYLRREGWGGSALALYSWTPNKGAPRRIMVTNDVIVGCELLRDDLLCAREGSLQPRRLVAIDIRDGHERILFDPNPEFASLRLGKVERLKWRTNADQESFGDLIMPPGPPLSGKRPLIIVQYSTRGFLRGGTGDEFPIQLFANAGYAVLSIQKPPPVLQGGPVSTVETMLVAMNRDWSDRRNIHASLMQGLERVLRRGDIDPTRIGITGLSDGSTSVQFALINSPGMFAAASIGTCCVDPTSMMIYGGTGLTDERTRWGYPPASGPRAEAWKPLTLAMNAPAAPPLLMQLADSEFRIGLETFTTLRGAHRPVELRIFPDEYHLKWQPAHRLAIYARNLAWFDFWLRGVEPVSDDAAWLTEVAGWRKLRADGAPTLRPAS